VVAALLVAHPEASRVKDGDGLLPLQQAACNNVSADVFALLLETYPEAAKAVTRLGRAALHDVLEWHEEYPAELQLRLLAAAPEAAAHEDKGGALPVHFASHPAVIRALLEAYPNGAKAWVDGCLPIHYAAERRAPAETIEVLAAAYLAALVAASPPDPTEPAPTSHPLDSQGRTALHRAVALSRMPRDTTETRRAGVKAPSATSAAFTSPVRQLEVVQALLLLTPHAASQRDNWGWLPLHSALFGGAAPEVVLALLAANPAAAATECGMNAYPLHFAVANGATSEVVTALLNAHPAAVQATMEGAGAADHIVSAQMVTARIAGLAATAGALCRDMRGLPLRIAVERNAPTEVVQILVAAYPDAATIQGPGHEYPLSRALDHVRPVGTIRAIIAAVPEAARLPNLQRRLPLHRAACRATANEAMQALIDAYPGAAHQCCSSGWLALLDACRMRKAAKRLPLASFETLLAANPAAASSPAGSGRTLLHEIAGSGASAAHVRAILDANEAAVRQADDQGRLPLHDAIHAGAPLEVIELLLAAYPLASSTANKHGCLPVHNIPDCDSLPAEASGERTGEATRTVLDVVLALVGLQPLLTETLGRRAQLHALLDNAAYKTTVRAYIDEAMARAAAVVNGRDATATELPWFPQLAAIANTDAARKLASRIVTTLPTAHVRALSQMKDDTGRCAVDAAPAPLRALILQRLFLLGRYDVKVGLPEHQSDTCVVRLAVDRSVDPPVPVALKFMRAREHFTREVTTREAHTLSADHVLELLRSHDGDAEPALLEEAPAHGFSAEHRYCVVLPAAERTLHDIIAHEHVAGRQWPLIASIARQLGEAMGHLHSKGLIHGDCKPLNIVRCRGGYRLIDLDACIEMGQPAGVKYSSGFVPPEMVELLPATGGKQVTASLVPAARAAGPLRTASGRVRAPPAPAGADVGAASGAVAIPAFSDGTVTASPALDMWGLGVTLYALCADQPLWLMSNDGSVDAESLATIARWEESDVGAELKRRKLAAIADPQARNLVSQLLSLNPQHRPSIARFLAHPFVSGRPAVRLPGQTPAYDVFLSYRVASDAAYVEGLYDLLTDRGLRVWWDARCLEPGRDWEEGFSEGLAASATIACVLSPGACENLLTLAPDSRCDNVLLEHRLALELQSMGMLGAVTPVLLNTTAPAAAVGGAGSLMAPAAFSGRFFPPTTRLPEFAVRQIEVKVASHLQRLCLGTPLHEGLGVRATMARLMQHQSFLLTPESEPVEVALTRAADVLERAARRARGELTGERQDADSRHSDAGVGVASAARTTAGDLALLLARELLKRCLL